MLLLYIRDFLILWNKKQTPFESKSKSKKSNETLQVKKNGIGNEITKGREAIDVLC